MPKDDKKEVLSGLGSLPKGKCNGFSTKHNDFARRSCCGSKGSDQARVNQLSELSGSYEDSNIEAVIMGRSQSTYRRKSDIPIIKNRDCVQTLDHLHRAQTAKKESAGSSSGEDDAGARELDVKGRATASDADLINAQRGEKTDVSPGLEDRWLRSHFSVTKTRSTELENGEKASGSKAHDQTPRKHEITLAKSPSVQDVIVKTSQDCCITVSSRSSTHSVRSRSKEVCQRLSILHFNDVYELTERLKEPVGGAARFATLFQDVAAKSKSDCKGFEPFVVFGGDCLNPSILSSATKGKHMVDVLNQLKVDAAVFGNHEFDFGVDHVVNCVKSMTFPWFLSNVTEKFNGEPLGDGVISRIITWNGSRLGIIGLIEEEWLDTLTTVDKCELSFEDYVTRGKELAESLKKEKVDLVIALTHMRWPNDIRLAQEVKDIDLILGGHDHEYGVKVVDDCVIVKSGCDFQTFSRVDLFVKYGGELDVSITRYDVTAAVKPDGEMKSIVERYMTVLEKQLQKPIGVIKNPLDGRYKYVRSRETNLGNFVADVMRMTTRAEIVLINSGTFRSNDVHCTKQGSGSNFTVRDLMSILPIHDNVVVLEVTGQQLLDGLENAVSKYPRHEGRFAQISGFCFGFDPKAAPGKRVVLESIRIRGEPLDITRYYKLATKAYVARGRDGYDCFSSCRLFNDPDSGPVLSTVVRNHISNVFQLLRHQETTGDKLKVVEGGKKIISQDGHPHEVYSAFFEEAPVYRLQKSMEHVLPKDVDINGNGTRRDNELTRKRDFVENIDEALQEGRAMHMQHLVEINRDSIFEKSTTVSNPIEEARRKAVEGDQENFKLLNDRQKTYEDVRWQVLPLVEGRVFHCNKK